MKLRYVLWIYIILRTLIDSDYNKLGKSIQDIPFKPVTF